MANFAKRLHAGKGKDICLVGGGEVVAAFLDSAPVDEFVLHPIPKLMW